MNRQQIRPQLETLTRSLPILILAAACILTIHEIQPLLARISAGFGLPPRAAEILYAAVFLISVIFPAALKREFPALNRAAVLAAAGVILLILFDISAKTVLRRDDYWEIYEARHRGFFDYLLFIFLTNSGRYSAFLIKSLYAVLPPLLWIRITIFLCGLLLLGCCFRIAKRLAAGRTNAFFLSIVLLSGIYLIQTKIWESFFWGGGGQIYAWGIACALAAWIFLGDALEKPTRVNLTTALLLAFLSAGFAQLINLAMLMLSGALALRVRIDKKAYTPRQGKTALAFFFVLILSTAIAFAMPGNYVNASQFFDDGQTSAVFESAAETIGNAILASFTGLIPHLRSQRRILLLLAAICFLTGIRISEEADAPKPNLGKSAAIALALWISAFFCLIINGVLGYYSSRVFSVPLTMIWIGTAYFSLTAGAMFAARLVSHTNARGTILTGLLIVGCLWLSFYVSVRPEMNRIYRTWTERDRRLTEIATTGEFDEKEDFMTCAIEINGAGVPDIPYGSYGWIIGRYYGLPTLTAETNCP